MALTCKVWGPSERAEYVVDEAQLAKEAAVSSLHSNVESLSLEENPKVAESANTDSFCDGPAIMDVSGGHISGPDKQRPSSIITPASAGFWANSRTAIRAVTITATNIVDALK